MTSVDELLVEDIYEAAVVPEYWPKVLERLGTLADADAASLITYGPAGSMRYKATERYQEAFADYAANGAHLPNLRPQRALERNPMAFAHDLEVCTQKELDQDPIYQRFARPYGFGWTSGTVVPVPSGDMLIFDMAKSISRGPFTRRDMERLDPLRPHLARAALLAERLELKAVTAATEALDIIGLPAAVLRGDSSVLAANASLVDLSPRIEVGAFNRLTLQEKGPNTLFHAAVSDRSSRTVSSVPLAATEQSPAMVAHVIPLHRAAKDIFTHADVLLVVTTVTAPNAPLMSVLTGLFDLTPAEAKVARAMSLGQSIEELAVSHGVSQNTARNQLRSVMAKTGTSRQAELAILLSGLRPLSTRSA